MHARPFAAASGAYDTGAVLPVVGQVPVRIDPDTRRTLAGVASRIRGDDPRLRSPRRFAPAARPGLDPAAPSLLIHDLKPAHAPGERPWSPNEYRALLLARRGDAVALWTPRQPAFEAYSRDVIGIGPVELLRPAGELDPATSLTVRCRRDPSLVRRVAARAARHGGLNVRPYIGSTAAWRLAAELGRRARTPISVVASPPALTRRANDKIWFAERVGEVLGERSLPPTASADRPEVLASLLRALARESDRIALKLPDASAGMGTFVIDAEPVRALSPDRLLENLGRIVPGLDVGERFPLLVSVWETPVVVSPSIQLWVPRRAAGDPVVEGIFEQRTLAPRGEFIGAAPARLPWRWCERLATEAVLLATLFQELGYYGRCSFDAILVGSDLASAQLHWVECNGRWGGTSIPLTAVNRLTGDWARTPFVVVHGVSRRPFAEALDRVRDRLFRPGRDRGLVFLSPGDPEEDQGIAFLTIGRSVEDAQRQAGEATALLE